MGYTTDFKGTFKLDKPLRPEHAKYLLTFSETRRMRRDADKAAAMPDPVREAVGLPIGDQGGYFVGGAGFMGQDDDRSVTDHNREPRGQPGLWCQWVPTDDGEREARERGESETGALGQDHPATVAVVEAHRRAFPCLCGSTTYEIVDVGDGLPRTDCCKAY